VLVFITATSFTIGLLLKDESTVTCPDVTGLDVEEAKRVADRVGLSVLVIKYEIRKDVPYNRILVQKPDASMPVKLGRTVSVVVSDGPRPVAFPSFVGLSLDDAQKALGENGMRVKKVIYVPSDDAGTVLAQVPGSGENIPDEEGVVLIVGGLEKRFFVMPDITGVDFASVVQELERKHMKFTIIPASPAEAGKTPVSKGRILPRTIFSDEQMLEIPISNGG
jgi:serine/threonine-protein kinase